MASWAADEGFQYEVWTDDNRTLSMHYGAIDSKDAYFPDRVTMLPISLGARLVFFASTMPLSWVIWTVLVPALTELST